MAKTLKVAKQIIEKNVLKFLLEGQKEYQEMWEI